jgi:hypothetical protein
MCSSNEVLVFNDIVEHDMTWGARCVRQAHNPYSPHIHHIFSLGLLQLYEIVTPEAPEGRREILYGVCPPESGLDKPNLLFNGLRERYGYPLYRPELSRVDPEMSFYRDPDTGPCDAYSWAAQQWKVGAIHSINGHCENEDLRDWGYVMWDRRRLDEMNAMDLIMSDERKPNFEFLFEQRGSGEYVEEESSYSSCRWEGVVQC